MKMKFVLVAFANFLYFSFVKGVHFCVFAEKLLFTQNIFISV